MLAFTGTLRDLNINISTVKALISPLYLRLTLIVIKTNSVTSMNSSTLKLELDVTCLK